MSDIYHSQSFVELLLKYVFQKPAVFTKAKALGMTPDDFLPAGDYQLPAYKILAGLALEVNKVPIDRELFNVLIRFRSEEGAIPLSMVETLTGILGRVYTQEEGQMDDYILEELPKFLRSRRSTKILIEAAGDIDRIQQEFKKVIFPLDSISASETPIEDRFVSPFKTVLKKQVLSMISTGFGKLNACLGGGLGYRELGVVVGHSGGGKTAMGTSFARGAAMMGFKAIYCSMEEEKEDIANRMYSAVFEVDYTTLHNGSGYMELEQKMTETPDNDTRRALLENNLIILDLKGLTPMKASTLKQLVDDYAIKNNYMYDLLVIDQLQFMEPEENKDGEGEWQREGRIMKEIDEITHQPVGGNPSKSFSAWVLHQAKGKVKIYFSTDEIAGFKGIVHKPETVLGLGREKPDSNDFELFSMKNRHAKNFRLPMHGDLSLMTFREKAEGPGDATAVAAARPQAAVTSAMMAAGNYGDPSRAQLLTSSLPPTQEAGPAPLSP